VMPSCVPAVSGFEDTGSAIGPKEVAQAMEWDEMVGLGEMMNFPGILYGGDHAQEIVAETLKADKVPTGHYSMPETGSGLNAYIASGMRCCHESTRMEDALEKMRRGMYAQFREGSAWHDLHQVSKAITENKVDTRYACLISDDTHPHTLIEKGHLDYILKRAVEEGIDPVTAIQMVTVNAAQCFRVDHEMGSIAPGKCADIVLLRDLTAMEVSLVLIDGDVVAKDGSLTVDVPPYTFPEWATHSMHIKDEIHEGSFRIPAPEGKETAKVRVIKVAAGTVPDWEEHVELAVKDGALESDPKQDVLKAFVFERHHATGTVGKGFVKGFGIQSGAMASTVAHDAHNLLVIGTNDADMALAANTLIACGGGLVAVQDGKVLGCVELPIAGLMNGGTVQEVADAVAGLEKAWESIGCTMPSPFMTMALIPLACLPQLRLTNRGLVDCVNFKFVPLVVEEE
ncbi:MAG: adenine deaminase, partial [Christensenellaceae bacterium]|nr:adenine deaminase [Christensenellaceae bacterium]